MYKRQHVNLLRTQTEEMSAALAGVDSMTVTPFDTTYDAPNEFSERMAVSYTHLDVYKRQAQVQAMTFHYFMPGIGMVGHGVEQDAVHVKKNGFQLDVGMPVLFQITGDRVFEHLVD